MRPKCPYCPYNYCNWDKNNNRWFKICWPCARKHMAEMRAAKAAREAIAKGKVNGRMF